MINCRACGHLNDSSWRYCENCDADLTDGREFHIDDGDFGEEL